MTNTLLVVQIILLGGVLVLVFPIGRNEWVRLLEYRRYLQWERSLRAEKKGG